MSTFCWKTASHTTSGNSAFSVTQIIHAVSVNTSWWRFWDSCFTHAYSFKHAYSFSFKVHSCMFLHDVFLDPHKHTHTDTHTWHAGGRFSFKEQVYTLERASLCTHTHTHTDNLHHIISASRSMAFLREISVCISDRAFSHIRKTHIILLLGTLPFIASIIFFQVFMLTKQGKKSLPPAHWPLQLGCFAVPLRYLSICSFQVNCIQKHA